MRKTTLLTVLIFFISVTVAYSQSHRVTSAWNYMQHGEVDEAYEAIEQAVEHPRTKDDARAWYYRGAILLQIAGSPDHAHLHDNALIDGYKSLKKALEYDRRGRYEREILESMQGLAVTFFNAGVEFYNNQQYATAYQYFNHYLEAMDYLGADEDPDGQFFAGYAAYMSDAHDEAKVLLSELAEAEHEEEALYAILSEIYLREGDTTEALAVLDIGQSLFPTNSQIIMTRVDIYIHQERTEELIENLEQNIANQPENMDLRLILATAYDQLERYEEAGEHYEVVAEERKDNFEVNYNYGAMLFNQGAQIANKALDTEDEEKAKAYDEEAKEIFNKALPYMERAYEINDEHRNTLVSLRLIYLRLQMMDKAQRVENRIEEVFGEDWDG